MTTICLSDYERDLEVQRGFRLGISQRKLDLIAALQIAYTLDEDERERAAFQRERKERTK